MLEAIFAAGMAPRVEGALFAYGDTLYIPGGFRPTDEVMAHEEVHSRQHANFEGKEDAWWNRYLTDQYFRVNQECEAYAVQYEAFSEKVRDRNRRALYLDFLAGQLSGPMYGNVIERGVAMKMIREKARI